MRVLINGTTLVKGGAIQVAASLIAESRKDPKGIEWHYAVSAQIADELKSLGVELAQLDVFEQSPARSLKAQRRLSDIETAVQPDVVFSLFGPVFQRFKAPHLLGVAVCWVTHSTWLAFSSLPSWLTRAKYFLGMVYRGFWLRAADRWVVEASNARDGLHRRMRVPLEEIDIVPNTCAKVFVDAGVTPAKRPEANETVRLFFVTAYYPHKNLEIVPEVAAELRRLAPERTFEFMITLPETEPALPAINARAAELGVSDMINNIGRITLNEVIQNYSTAHLCFMPSLLEAFSASYPEAMALGRPIVASDLDFARAVCKDAAVYFDPTSATSAAETILELLNDEQSWQRCLEQGKAVLAELPDATRKYEMFVESIRRTAAVAT